MALLGECRCCRRPIPRSQLACPPHWAMLPKQLKEMIQQTYSDRQYRVYAAYVTEADGIWQAAGLWKPPVPMTHRADKGMNTIRTALKGGNDAT